MIGAIVLAGGRGSRFGADMPKQFADIHGRPVLIHALQTYVGAGLTDRVILVTPPDLLDHTHALLARHDLDGQVAVCAGGPTRQASIRLGVAAAQAAGASYRVLILHNAASPNTDHDTVRRCVAALEEADVVQACHWEQRTLFETADGYAVRLLDREHTACSCDPTAFRAEALHAVLAEQQRRGLQVDTTTDVALDLGLRVKLVASPPGNIKITGPWDLATLHAAMEGRPA